MSYVRYYAGNLRTDGTFCQWDGVSACLTRIIIVLEGKLYRVEGSASIGGICPGFSDVVVYYAGNLRRMGVSSSLCVIA